MKLSRQHFRTNKNWLKFFSSIFLVIVQISERCLGGCRSSVSCYFLQKNNFKVFSSSLSSFLVLWSKVEFFLVSFPVNQFYRLHLLSRSIESTRNIFFVEIIFFLEIFFHSTWFWFSSSSFLSRNFARSSCCCSIRRSCCCCCCSNIVLNICDMQSIFRSRWPIWKLNRALLNTFQ